MTLAVFHDPLNQTLLLTGAFGTGGLRLVPGFIEIEAIDERPEMDVTLEANEVTTVVEENPLAVAIEQNELEITIVEMELLAP